MPRVQRLSREQSKEQTRARLIAVGRKHFLRHGFIKSTSEEITKEAGYTRGALHSNFEDKEGLLLEVVREFHRRQNDHFATLIRDHTGGELFTKLRESFSSLLDNPDYFLTIEFEHASLRNKRLRAHYLVFHEESVRMSCKILTSLMATSDIRLNMEPADFIVAVSSFIYGLAAKKILLHPELTSERTHHLMRVFFDSFLSRVPSPHERDSAIIRRAQAREI